MAKYIYTFIVFGFISLSYGKEMPQRLENKSVYDLANVLNEDETKKLEAKLQKYKDSTSTEVLILISNDLVMKEGNLYATELSKSWGLSDNSIVILSDINKVVYGFHIGKSLKPHYPDWALEKIEHKYLRSNFRDKDYYKGLDETTTTFINLKSGVMKAEDLKKDSSNVTILLLLVIFVFLLIAFPIIKFRAFRKSHFSTKSADVYSTILLMNNYGPPAKACFDDFRKGMGRFSNVNNKKALLPSGIGGGGVSGSW
jgi:uncharacterized membrane protein YgcG